MEIKTNDKSDQANDLRSLFAEIEENQVELSKPENEQHEDDKEDKKSMQEFDILNLPPRKEIHLNNKRARLKFSTPLIQFLLVIFVIVILLTGAYFYWGEEIIDLIY